MLLPYGLLQFAMTARLLPTLAPAMIEGGYAPMAQKSEADSPVPIAHNHPVAQYPGFSYWFGSAVAIPTKLIS